MTSQEKDNLVIEYENLIKATKQGFSVTQNMNSFFKTIKKNKEAYQFNLKKSLNDILTNSQKDIVGTNESLSKSLSLYYGEFESLNNKQSLSLSKLDKEIIDPMDLFYQHLTSTNKENLEIFKTIINSNHEAKKNLEKFKHKYYEASKNSITQEKINAKIYDEKYSSNDEEVSEARDTLLKFKGQADNSERLLKYEIGNTNKTLEENYLSYLTLKDKIRNGEESRIFFLKIHLEKFNKIIEDINSANTDFMIKANTFLNQINIENDISAFDTKFSSPPFHKEEFVSYQNHLKKKLTTEDPNVSSDSDTSLSDKEIKFLKDTKETKESEDEEFEIITTPQSEDQYNSYIENYLRRLFSEQTVTDTAKLMELIFDSNMNTSKTFIDKILIKERKNIAIQFLNYFNFQDFANILITISLNNDSVKRQFFDLNFAVIFIAERTYIMKDNIKVYLCMLLSKNNLFSSRGFWVDLIERKVSKLLLESLNVSVHTKGSSKQYDIPPLLQEGKNIFNGMKSAFKNFFKNDDDQIKENKINSQKHLENLKIMKEQKIKKQAEVFAVLKEFIPHFANFNFDVSIAIDIIVEEATKYEFSKDKISFFVTFLNSSVFTIKNNKYYQQLTQPSNSSNVFKLNDSKIAILIKSAEFLDKKQQFNLLTLNKLSSKKLEKLCLKSELLKKNHSNTRIRVAIWKKLLKYNELKDKYDYSKVIGEKNLSALASSIHEIIGLDVNRTFFENEINVSREKITRILKAIASCKPEINYCQGMNYIATFLLHVTETEEEAFYIMLGLFDKTEFKEIFLNDLAKLKQFFYVFERLISIYLPELNTYFKIHKISTSFFCSSWFITLYTNSVMYLSDVKNPKIVLRIWDEFLLKGWTGMYKAGLIMLKSYEKELVQFKYEHLLNFLINDLIKSRFFQNDNFDNFIEVSKSIKIKSGLINNLENEYIQGEKLIIDEKKK